MSQESSPTENLAALFAGRGFAHVEPPILQPAEVFLDVSGEELRRRLFLTTDPAGHELCLRPDLTIPTARLHVAGGDPGRVARYSYLGPVFRYRPDAASEFVQGGAESFGATDAAAEDAAMLALAVESVRVLGCKAPTIRIGDVGLLAALVRALDLPAAWGRRLLRDLSRGRAGDVEAMFANGGSIAEHPALLGALAGLDQGTARAIVQDLLSIAGVAEVGGRSAEDIAGRFLERADLAGARLSDAVREMIGAFLAISGPPEEVAARLRALSREAGIDLGPALETFERRTRLLAAQNLDIGTMQAATAFGRNLDYYTGLVFELGDPARPGGQPITGGGRYDRLLLSLGASGKVPAVGFSIWLDRVPGDAR